MNCNKDHRIESGWVKILTWLCGSPASRNRTFLQGLRIIGQDNISYRALIFVEMDKGKFGTRTRVHTRTQQRTQTQPYTVASWPCQIKCAWHNIWCLNFYLLRYFACKLAQSSVNLFILGSKRWTPRLYIDVCTQPAPAFPKLLALLPRTINILPWS